MFLFIGFVSTNGTTSGVEITAPHISEPTEQCYTTALSLSVITQSNEIFFPTSALTCVNIRFADAISNKTKQKLGAATCSGKRHRSAGSLNQSLIPGTKDKRPKRMSYPCDPPNSSSVVFGICTTFLRQNDFPMTVESSERGNSYEV